MKLRVGLIAPPFESVPPRLYGGTERVVHELACKPQAWAAGSLFLVLRSLLGLRMRDTEMDLRFYRSAGSTAVKSERKKGTLRLLTVRSKGRSVLD